MKLTYEEIEAAATALSDDERSSLAQTLLESLRHERIERVWDDEIGRRVESWQRGEASSTPAVDVHARLRAKLS